MEVDPGKTEVPGEKRPHEKRPPETVEPTAQPKGERFTVVFEDYATSIGIYGMRYLHWFISLKMNHGSPVKIEGCELFTGAANQPVFITDYRVRRFEEKKVFRGVEYKTYCSRYIKKKGYSKREFIMAQPRARTRIGEAIWEVINFSPPFPAFFYGTIYGRDENGRSLAIPIPMFICSDYWTSLKAMLNGQLARYRGNLRNPIQVLTKSGASRPSKGGRTSPSGRPLDVDPGDTTVPGEDDINKYWPSQKR
jgi:hypothetical protein